MSELWQLLAAHVRTRVSTALKRRALRLCESNISYFELQQIDAQTALRHLHSQKITLEYELQRLERSRP